MKGMLQTPNIRDIKSMHIVGARSIPKVQRSRYLELYVLSREKERLEKELYGVDRRKKTCKKRLDMINRRFKKVQKEINEEQDVKSYRHIPTRPLKTMSIKY